jgi:VWFA-related protein
LIVALVGVGLAASSPQQPPTFRAGVDLVAVDVQVVDKDGQPMVSLSPDKFSVTIDGHERRVISVDLIRHSEDPVAREHPIPPAGSPIASNMWPPTGAPGRTFVLAVDAGSFTVEGSRDAVSAARGFIERLQPDDLIGLYTYPLGPHVDPTRDRAKVRRELDTIVGGAQAMHSQFHLTAGEVVDINAENASMAARMPPPSTSVQGRGNSQTPALLGNESETLRRVQIRECGSDTDVRCVESIQQEAQAMAFFYEGEMTRAVTGLGELLQGLGDYPGRKTVIVVSAGMPVSDRPGGRPNVGDAARALGEEAARANANVYALHLDRVFQQAFSAENRRSDKTPVSRERESVMMGRFLDQFAGTSGGTLLRILVGSGEQAYEQILRETSAYYLIGVSPAESDRDGHTHRLRVKVDQRNATVRSRTWVLVPKKRT